MSTAVARIYGELRNRGGLPRRGYRNIVDVFGHSLPPGLTEGLLRHYMNPDSHCRSSLCCRAFVRCLFATGNPTGLHTSQPLLQGERAST